MSPPDPGPGGSAALAAWPGAALDALLAEGVVAGIFPSVQAAVWLAGTPIHAGRAGAATARTRFDLASLTKVMATTAVFLSLWREGVITPDDPVARFFPDSTAGRAGATLADLLLHRAGLPAFAPLFASALREHPVLLEPACPPAVRAVVRQAVVASARATPMDGVPRTRAVYSDVGFLLLGEVLALAGGGPLDRLFAERVAAPLALEARFVRLSAGERPGDDVAPTGWLRPREPAPGQEGLWSPLPTRPSPPGEVDDDNAWVMDGVAGHAGLFGTAADVAAFGQAMLDDLEGAGRIAPPALWAKAVARDGETSGSTRAFGFDTRLPGDVVPAPSAGRYLGATPPGALGHLGFTGTSLWIDCGRRLVVALCANRTAGPTGRADTRIGGFRPRFQDAVVEAFGLAPGA